MGTEFPEIVIYVDQLRESRGRWKWRHYCHLFSEDSDEDNAALHAFAQGLGIQRDWFQNPTLLPHYDLNAAKRQLAIDQGAVEIDIKEIIRGKAAGTG